MGRLSDGIEEAAISIGGKVDGNVGTRSDGTSHLNIQIHFAISAIRVACRVIARFIDRDGSNFGQRNIQLLEVGFQILLLETSAQLDQRDTLTCPIDSGRVIVELSYLRWSIGSRGCVWLNTAQMWAGLRAIIKAEDALHNIIQAGWDVQRTGASTIATSRALIDMQLSGEGAAQS